MGTMAACLPPTVDSLRVARFLEHVEASGRVRYQHRTHRYRPVVRAADDAGARADAQTLALLLTALRRRAAAAEPLRMGYRRGSVSAAGESTTQPGSSAI